MDALLRVGLANTAWAAVLAVVAWCAARVWKRSPALAHLLWIVVMLKLVTPSLVALTWPARPAERVARPEPATGVAHHQRVPLTPSQHSGRAIREPDAPTPPTPVAGSGRATPITLPWRAWLATVWLLGGAAWWATVGLYARRVGQLVRAAQPAGAELTARAERLAAGLRLRACPAIGIVPARIPPMLWALFDRPRLLLPEELWVRLDRAQQDAVLAHELAHLKRGDHWVRRLEVLVLGLHWWDPLAWWARREVERAEEPCCDAWVAWALPGSADDYAEALVATAAFLSGPRPFRPVGASGVGRTRLLKRRLNMILSDAPSGGLSRGAPRTLIALAAVGLLWLPAFASQGQDSPSDPAGAPKAAREGRGAPEQDDAKKAGPAAEQTVHPVQREVSDFADFNGQLEAVRSVSLQPRISAAVTRVAFPNGGMVKRGDLLFELDDRVYRSELRKAEAEAARARARFKAKDAMVNRQEGLIKRGPDYVSKEELEQTRSARDEAEADVSAAQATLELAQLHLDSTRITAPIDGRVSAPHVIEGNVAAADKTSLATISALDFVAMTFVVDEQTALRVRRLVRAGELPGANDGAIPVTMGLVGEAGFPHRGRVLSLFSPANSLTQWRAVFPNDDGFLGPGLTGRVRVTTSAPHTALLVPQRAVFRDQRKGPYVSVMLPNQPGRVEPRYLKVGLTHGGDVEVLGGRLSPEDALYIEPEAK